MKRKKSFVMILLLLGLSFILIGTGLELSIPNISNNVEAQTIAYAASNTGDFTYLSDIDYVKDMSFTRYDQIRYDQISGGAKISLKIENSTFTFDRGIWAHAASQITYDISQYNYKYFTAFIGINTTSNKGNGVTYTIYTSNDGKDFGEAKLTQVKLPGEVATFIKVDISGAKYLRLCISDNGSNGNDHSVYADAKLVNSVDNSFAIKSVQEYDEILKSKYANQTEISGEYELTLLQRDLVNNMGQYTINSFYNASTRNKEALDWLMNNLKVLSYYIYGGAPEGGSYYNSLTELSRLYYNYKDDFNNTTVINNKWEPNLTYGDLYTKMAVSLSLTHSQVVGLWMNSTASENRSDSVRRYAIYKYMYHTGRLKASDTVDMTPWFEALKVEEMRFIMNNAIDDEEILWLNDYVSTRIAANGGNPGNLLTPHPYIAYVWPNYQNAVYYAEENISYFNELFAVNKTSANSGKELVDANGKATGKVGLWDAEYKIPGGKESPEYTLKITRGTPDYKLYKVWMNFRNKFGTGAVCGGISKSGSNIRTTHGIPATVIGQPGHAALLYYGKNNDTGIATWGIDNDVSGWTLSEKGERLLIGWGNGSYAKGSYQVVYMLLGQDAINDFDNFVKAERFIKLANVYSGDLVKQEALYREAIKAQSINLDAWLGLINVYNASENKTEDDYYDLAEELAEALKYHPLPMYHLTNLIQPKLTTIGSVYKLTLLQTRILTEATQTPNTGSTTSNPGAARTEANFLLGKIDKEIATFSFDGDDAGKIVLSSRFDGSGVRWDYSIDGKKTWHEVSFTGEEEHKHQLTVGEIASITSENDIYVHIVGVNYDEKNLYKIDIKESAGLPATLYANDSENRLIGAIDAMEWKYSAKDQWMSYKKAQPNLEGDKTVIVRVGATGVYLAEKTSTTYTFTKNNDPETRKYIPVKHLSLEAVSTEATSNQGAATNALDANYNTRWHSAWNGSDTERYITVKLDEPVYLSAVEFVPAGGGNGKIYDGTIYGSMDGENWQVLSQSKNLTYTNNADTVEQAIANIKSFDMEEPVKVQYVKIVADRTNGNWVTARAFNFYQDTTIKSVVDFSFDGKDAGKIILSDAYKDKKWKYSIDGGKTWKNVNSSSHQLTTDELNSINAEDDIKVVLEGDTKEYSVSIRKGPTPEVGYLNDLENRPIGLVDVNRLEWKLLDDKNWTSYEKAEPNVEGNQTLLVRTKATGISTASDSVEYHFTADNQPDTAKYVPIKHLSIEAYSTQSVDANRPYYAPNAIDGNLNTLWHTDFRYSVLQQEQKPFLTIKLDEPRYISALEFIQNRYKKDDLDYIKDAIVYVSMDGEEWTEVGKLENCDQTEELRRITLDQVIYGQYVKFEMETYDVFASVAMINLFEDSTKIVKPKAIVNYSTTQPTNQNVVVTLVNLSEGAQVVNNDGKTTYTFTENGEFTFELIDQNGNIGSVVAKVDWIDKEAPTAIVTYDITTLTNQNVVATIDLDDKDAVITNNNGKNTYTFTENGEFVFEFVDKAGNTGRAVARVDWINKNDLIARVTYSTTALTNKNVVATVEFNRTDVKITNNNGNASYTFSENGEFTFEYVDAAGNVGSVVARVDWINKENLAARVVYDITSPTNKNVVATIEFNKEKVRITNNNGKNTYTFTENGEFVFEYVDDAGNTGRTIAKVDWIVKDTPLATISYNTTDLTNKDVVATIQFSGNVTITNNGGKNTYIFTENGEFTFEYIDDAGNIGSAVAKVDWIDKKAPTATITYSIKQLTDKDVIATITFNKKNVKITNNNGKNTYTFTKNGEFTFAFVDELGNVGSAVAKVDWIEKDVFATRVTYDITKATNKNVVATLEFNKAGAKVTNNNGKNTYTFTKNGEFTFEYVDPSGNKGKAVARVTWIDKESPIATITYDVTTVTTKYVVATVTFNKKNVKIVNNDGKNTYVFTENGSFTFEYVDEAGNVGKAIAKVDWIKKTANKPQNKPQNKPSVTPSTKPQSKPSVAPSTKPQTPNVSTPSTTSPTSTPAIISKPSIAVVPDSNNQDIATSDNGIVNDNDQDKLVDNTEIMYNTYKNGIVSVKVPMDEIKETVSLELREFELSKSLKEKIGEISKAFDLYFETENKDKRYFESTSMIITIDVDSIKNLKVYRITDDGQLEKLEYTKLGNDKIEIETKGLGKYVLSTAKEKKDDTKKIEKRKQVQEKTSEIEQDEMMNIYLSILGIALIIISILLIIKAKRRKNKYVNYVI